MDWNEIAGLINGEHCTALMLILVLCCILSGRKALSERVHQGSFWITIIACTLLAAQNILENYAQLDQITGDRTAIYISHRLSSCRFCDEILVFDHGQIVQRGAHEVLVNDADGKYHALWHAQAQYYEEA